MAWKVVKWGGFGETATLQCECVCARAVEKFVEEPLLYFGHMYKCTITVDIRSTVA